MPEPVRTGSMLGGLVFALSDVLPADVDLGEGPAAVIMDIWCGTTAVELLAADAPGPRYAADPSGGG